MSERLVEKKLNGRSLTDPRDTFDWTTPNLNVTARATDPYVSPAASDAQKLAQSLGLIQDVAQQYGNVQEIKNKEAYDEGKLSRAKGEDKAEGKRRSYIQGWEQLDGELRAQEFDRQSKDYLELHKDEDFETFQKGYNDLSKSFLDQLGTEDTVKGFINRGLDIEDRTSKAHHKYQQEKIKQEQYTKVTAVMNNDVDAWLTNTLGVKSLNDLITDDNAYLKFYSDRENFIKNFQTQFSQYRKDAKKKYSTFFNDREIGQILYQTLKSKADYYDMPELMSVMETSDGDLKEVDNINAQDDLYGVLQKSSSGQAKRLSAINKKFENEIDTYVNKQTNYYYSKIADLDPNDIAGAKALKLELDKDSTLLENANVSGLYNQIDNIMESEGFAKTSDKSTFYSLDEKRWKRTLTYKDLTANRKNLSQQDYEDLRGYLETDRRRQEDKAEQLAREKKQDAKEAAKEAQRKKEKAEDDGWYDHNKEMSTHYGALIDSVKKFDKFKQWTNPKETYKAQDYLGSLIREFKQKNKGREPMGTEWEAIEESFYRRFPPGMSMSSSEAAPVTPKKPQESKPKKEEATPPDKKKNKRVRYNPSTGKMEEVK